MAIFIFKGVVYIAMKSNLHASYEQRSDGIHAIEMRRPSLGSLTFCTEHILRGYLLDENEAKTVPTVHVEGDTQPITRVMIVYTPSFQPPLPAYIQHLDRWSKLWTPSHPVRVMIVCDDRVLTGVAQHIVGRIVRRCSEVRVHFYTTPNIESGVRWLQSS